MLYKNYVKRAMDFILALAGLIVFSPIFVLVTISLYLVNNGKPFFFQLRPGKNGVLFEIIKFKTMTEKRGTDGSLLPDDQRLTHIGSFVRKTSLDEIPQLINVVKGEMSLIGPRPLLPEYLPLYSAEQFRRHEVRPGITGWAQINGRNAISWQQKFKLDIWYINNLNFWLDLKIMLLTIKKVVVKENISSKTSVTMEKFNGN